MNVFKTYSLNIFKCILRSVEDNIIIWFYTIVRIIYLSEKLLIIVL